MTGRYDVMVVGSGPNGLAAAAVLARAGLSVLIREGQRTVGGGVRSAFLTRPGFVHDLCSAVYPLAVGSPLLSTLPLGAQGLEGVHPPYPLAHPFDDGTAVALARSIDETAEALGPDGARYRGVVPHLLNAGLSSAARSWPPATLAAASPVC